MDKESTLKVDKSTLESTNESLNSRKSNLSLSPNFMVPLEEIKLVGVSMDKGPQDLENLYCIDGLDREVLDCNGKQVQSKWNRHARERKD